ncbi:hypothetical protein PBI_ASERPROCKY_53 [Gordonia phage ASerpRocky]|uniref:Uncharacterized protein n=1 Tax=Gordonia phage ASerpRocky TaxID=2599841 RepID=A0A5J6TFN0_9CAUD|nr:hypothetical protein PBI_ASERPROCKY_53 [Gordonia phage ASerpRocky]
MHAQNYRSGGEEILEVELDLEWNNYPSPATRRVVRLCWYHYTRCINYIDEVSDEDQSIHEYRKANRGNRGKARVLDSAGGS